MSYTGLTAPGMTEPPRHHNVTVIVEQDGGHHLKPCRVRRGSQQVASARTASIVSAHTAGQIVSIVTVLAPISLRLMCPPDTPVSDVVDIYSSVTVWVQGR
jgi:hypothetical protein